MITNALIGHGRTADIYAWGEGQVLKLFHSDWQKEDIEYEAQVARIVSDAGLDAPAVGDIVNVDGRVGLVYERIAGPTMVEAFVARPWRLFELARQFARLHAAMHNCTRDGLPSQRQRLRKKIAAAPGLEVATKERLLQILEGLPDGTSVCHGDFHPENVILSPRGAKVIDWNDASQGNALADVARTSLLLRLATPMPSWNWSKRTLIQSATRTFESEYRKEYFKRRAEAGESMEVWMPLQAAARLCEEIPGEAERLIAWVKTAFTAESAESAEKS